jgi:hypothetical protein
MRRFHFSRTGSLGRCGAAVSYAVTETHELPKKQAYIIVDVYAIVPEGAKHPSERGFRFVFGDCYVHLNKANRTGVGVSRLWKVGFG